MVHHMVHSMVHSIVQATVHHKVVQHTMHHTVQHTLQRTVHHTAHPTKPACLQQVLDEDARLCVRAQLQVGRRGVEQVVDLLVVQLQVRRAHRAGGEAPLARPLRDGREECAEGARQQARGARVGPRRRLCGGTRVAQASAQHAGSPEASVSARPCSRLPQAPASLGHSAAWAALAPRAAIPALLST